MGETLKRIIAGFTIGGIVIVLLNTLHFIYGLHALLFITIIAVLGLEEYYRLTDKGVDGRPIRILGFTFGFLFLLSYYTEFLYESRNILSLNEVILNFIITYQEIKNPVIPILVLFVIFTKAYSMMFRPLDGNAYNVMSTITGVLYIALPLAIILPMLVLPEGIFIFVYTALATIMTDVGAYFAGRWFGKHNAGLKVSPKKTWEGYIGGILFANLFNLGFIYAWLYFHPDLLQQSKVIMPSYIESIILTLIFSFISIIGDLVESALKRDAKTKDSSTIIPGHGGVLDLVDAMLFTFPLGYFYFYIKIKFLL
ncbi:MAG: CDP-diglyceride synthetase [Leptospiraceae bacterium]|nr:MAG: CDP-diglyceride synthetase [Leptospiraceae bacterium]